MENEKSRFYIFQGVRNVLRATLETEQDLSDATQVRLRATKGYGHDNEITVVEEYDGQATDLAIPIPAEDSSVPLGTYLFQLQLLDSSDEVVAIFPENPAGAAYLIVLETY